MGPFGATYVNSAFGTGNQVVDATCDTGDFATGGGVTSASGAVIKESLALASGSPAGPGQTPNGWRGQQETFDSGTSVQVWVICTHGQPV
jgi:hypothetical protein